ncbi:hypothetical protein GTA08_BOTSDO09833 [Neofusicoccum parvum]|nr:hypothetical protein GTA08_BOTSDO09833 [Neofusicoccum parvum]
MATFSATLHQRVASPVTPAHSPQHSHHSLHSTSSTRSYTPIHSLSLHEYRRQQAEPTTPEPPGGRRLKRKTAATRLNAAEREPLLPQVHPPPLVPSPPSTSHSEPNWRDPKSSFANVHVSSFRSLPALQQRPSLGLRDIAKLNASAADLPDLPHTGAPQAPALPRDFGLGSRKRLPRPKNIEIRQPLVASPIRSDPSSLDLLSTAGLASTSTFTLSKFPFPDPPGPQPGAQANPPLNVWPRESNPELTPSLLDTPPATPAVLHFRGTSFDVVNPHNSLYDSHLETPADLEGEPNDYFNRTSLDNLLPADMDNLLDRGDGAERPQRPLFDDLRSAHASIAKTRFQSPKQTPTHDHAEAMLSSVLPSTASSQKLDRRTSIMDRARGVFRKNYAKPVEVQDEGMKSIPYEATYENAIPGSGAYYSSAPTMNDQHNTEDARPSVESWETVPASDSDMTLPVRHEDQASMYADSEYFSNSQFFGPLNSRRSVPFGVQNQITDYSGEVSYVFADTPQHSAKPSTDSQIVRSLSKTIDYTLGNIYDQYGGVDQTQATFSTEDPDTDEDDDASTIRVPSLRSIVPSSPRENRNSGLEKFDFGLDDRHSDNAESPTSSPVTPKDGDFPKVLGLMRASAGIPPNSPPPLAPPERSALRPAYTPVSDDYSNRASSYEDTRKLLGISSNVESPNVNRMSVITEGSRLSEGGKLPQSPLQEFIERCDSQRGTPDLGQANEKLADSQRGSWTTASTDAVTGPQVSEKENVAPRIPPMWMRASSPGPTSARNESPASMATDASATDWETLAQTTTAGGHSRENSEGQTLRRQAAFEDLSPIRRKNTNPWRNRVNTDGSSPVVGSATETRNIPRFPRDSELSFLPHSRNGKQSLSLNSSAGPSQASDSYACQLSPEQMTNYLAFGPSEDILEEHELSQLPKKSQAREFAHSSSFARAKSQVISSDRFSMANVTGTPMGTGVRDAGSSIVGDSSSPASNIQAQQEVFPSSPPAVSTPARESLLTRSNNRMIYSPTTGGMNNAGANYRTPSTHISSPLARGSIVSSQSSRIPTINSYGRKIDELRAASSTRAERHQRMRAASLGSSSRTTTPRAQGPMTIQRASVRGQRYPFAFELKHRDSMTMSSERSEFANIVRPDSTRTMEPLYRYSPHLNQLPRPDSSDMTEKVQKKTQLSWAIFAMCAWFPPTAILLFLGVLDGLMFHMSHREVEHVGQFQKKCALVAFILEIVALVVVLVLWLVHVI